MPHVINAGVDYFTFWDMTIGEIQLHLRAFAEAQNHLRKQTAADLYNLACLVSKAFAGKLRGLYDEFPKLFDTEARTAELDDFVNQMINFAAGHNAQHKGGDS